MEKKFRLKQFIDNVGVDRVIDDRLKVAGGVVFLDLDIHFKYTQGNWWQLCDTVWVNLQGGVPEYDQETMIDELLFEAKE